MRARPRSKVIRSFLPSEQAQRRNDRREGRTKNGEWSGGRAHDASPGQHSAIHVGATELAASEATHIELHPPVPFAENYPLSLPPSLSRLSAVVICFDGRPLPFRRLSLPIAALELLARRYAVSVSMRDMTVSDKHCARAPPSRTDAPSLASLLPSPPLDARRCRCSMIFLVTQNIIRILLAVGVASA